MRQICKIPRQEKPPIPKSQNNTNFYTFRPIGLLSTHHTAAGFEYLCNQARSENVRFCRRQGYLDCRGADIRVRRACRTRPVAPQGKADCGSRRRGERGAPSGTPRCCRNSRTSPGWPAADRMPGDPGDPGQAEGCQPRNHPASQASAGGQSPERRGGARQCVPSRRGSRVRLPSMSAPRHAVTLSDTGRHGERAKSRRYGRNLERQYDASTLSRTGRSVCPPTLPPDARSS